MKLKLQNFWPPEVKSWFTGKDPDAGKDWRQEEKETTEDEMVGWHHWLDMSLSKLQEVVKDREALCAAFLGVTESDMTDRVNTTTNKIYMAVSGLSWGTQDLPLQFEAFVGVAHGLNCSAACGILVPPPGIESKSPALQGGFLTTGPPGKPPKPALCCVSFTCHLKSPVASSFKINTWLQSMAMRLAEHCEFNSLGKYFSLLRWMV